MWVTVGRILTYIYIYRHYVGDCRENTYIYIYRHYVGDCREKEEYLHIYIYIDTMWVTVGRILTYIYI